MLVENQLKKLKTFDSSYFRGKSHFEEDGTEHYLVFQAMYRYFKRVEGVATGNCIYLSDYSISPQLCYLGSKTRLEFRGSCLKQDKITFNHKKLVNI